MRIAYCEDEPAQRSRMELLLRTFAERKRLPLTVEAFSDSAAFLFQYPGSYPFDLIFLDIDLGGMDGMALARKIRETDSEVPILFLTNHKEYVFEGWYREGILLSKEEDYRIQILSDESITAKFVKKRTPKVVKLSKTKYVYDGKIKNPGVIVLDGDGNRVSSDHYTVSYQAGRKKVGQYHVNVKMKNKYCGSKTLSFKIVPKATKITKVIKKKKALSISWKKQKKQVSGYQIQVSTSRKFKSKKTKNISGMKKNSTTVSKLKSRKKYYIRIRTWKKKNRKKYYSAWSKVKIGKTK